MARLEDSYAHDFASLRRSFDAIARGATVTDGPPCETGKPWRRQANDVGVGAEFYCCPQNVSDIIGIRDWAKANDRTVRAVGVGHSYSDVVETTGILVDMSKITGVVGDIDVSQIQHPDDPKKSHAFVTVRAGTSIKELNKALRKHKPPRRREKMPLAMEIMGSYDAQHIAGAVSTGTHGSGRNFGPIESRVDALKIVTADGEERTLHRVADDEEERQEFLAAVISMGCAGIITEMRLRVVPAYDLFEERLLQDWLEIRKAIADSSFHDDPAHADDPEYAEEWLHAEVSLDPYPTGKKNRTCLVTKRRRPTKKDRASKPPGHRTGLSSYAAGLSKLLKPILAWMMRRPKRAARFVRGTLKHLAHKGYLDRSDKVLQLGAENKAVKIAEGIEYMFRVRSDHSDCDIGHLLDVVDELLAIGKRRYKANEPFLSAPINMRFVHRSEALVAPQWGVGEEDYVVALEMGVVESIKGAREILEECERLMVSKRGRPHWGLNFNHYCPTDIEAAYGDRFKEWKTIVRGFNASHVFDNALTKRLGIWTDPPEEVQPT